MKNFGFLEKEWEISEGSVNWFKLLEDKYEFLNSSLGKIERPYAIIL